MCQLRSRWPTATAIVLLAALAGCSDVDPRIKELETGVSRDSALKVLGGTPTDSTPYIYDVGRFLIDGRNIEVLYYDPKGRRRYRDSVPGDELTPVVVEGGNVTAKGWAEWDAIAGPLGIQVPVHTIK